MTKDKHRPERVIQRELIDKLNTLDECFAFKAESTFNRGIPDVVCCYKGRFIGIEVKKYVPGRLPEYDASAIQLYVGELIKDAGGIFFVTNDPDDAIKRIKRAIDE